MSWNWRQPNWPDFVWDASRLAAAEALFAEGAGVLAGVSRHLESGERDRLRVELMSHEALDSAAIEGEALDRDSVQSSIRRQLGLDTPRRRASPAEAGMAGLMVDLYTHVASPLDEAVLHRWHGLLANGRSDLTDVGRYRSHAEPMQIVSGPLQAQTIHFEAPPSSQVGAEMAQFWRWLERTAPRGQYPLPPLTRAGLAHLWFESVHPYEDGNGRIGRALSEKLLAQGLNAPVITGMAGTLLRHRKAYYAQLERAHGDLEITGWLTWFAAKALEAQQRTQGQLDFVVASSRLMERLRQALNPRQEKALARLIAAGPDGFVGGFSAANYMRITDTPPATASRDLAGLVALGALARAGERKATRYRLAVQVPPPQVWEIGDLD